jgi:hypothetical protein
VTRERMAGFSPESLASYSSHQFLYSTFAACDCASISLFEENKRVRCHISVVCRVTRAQDEEELFCYSCLMSDFDEVLLLYSRAEMMQRTDRCRGTVESFYDKAKALFDARGFVQLHRSAAEIEFRRTATGCAITVLLRDGRSAFREDPAFPCLHKFEALAFPRPLDEPRRGFPPPMVEYDERAFCKEFISIVSQICPELDLNRKAIVQE